MQQRAKISLLFKIDKGMEGFFLWGEKADRLTGQQANRRKG